MSTSAERAEAAQAQFIAKHERAEELAVRVAQLETELRQLREENSG